MLCQASIFNVHITEISGESMCPACYREWLWTPSANHWLKNNLSFCFTPLQRNSPIIRNSKTSLLYIIYEYNTREICFQNFIVQKHTRVLYTNNYGCIILINYEKILVPPNEIYWNLLFISKDSWSIQKLILPIAWLK